jgi:GT2 family glycosyltransferase
MITNSLIICTKDRFDDLKKSFNSLLCQSVLPSEIVVVDSSTSDSTQRYLEELKQKTQVPIKYLKSASGLALQRNIGIQNSFGDILHFLDDDVDLDYNYIKRINEIYEADEMKKIMGVGGRLVDLPIKRFNLFVRTLFMLPRYNGSGIIQLSGFPAFQWISNLNKIASTDILCGLSSYRKEVFNNFKFDEKFEQHGYMEDIDFSYRVSRIFSLIYTPYAKIYHRQSNVSRPDHKKLYKMIVVNQHYFYMKNMKKSIDTALGYLWSKIGLFIDVLLVCSRSRNHQALIGYFLGIKEIL